MMKSTTEKVRENRVRRVAQRQGLRLEKSPRRDPRALDYGLYRLVNVETKMVELGTGHNDFGYNLDEVERWLNS